MKNFLTSLKVGLQGAILGLFIGFWMNILNNISYNTEHLIPSTPEWTAQFSTIHQAYAVSAILWMLMGVLFTLASYWIFAKNPWDLGLAAATVIHFVTTWIGFIAIAILAGWISFSWLDALIIFAQFSIIYVIICGIQFVYARKKVKELNANL